VPAAVAAELASPGAPDAVRAWVGQPPSWVEVLPIASDALATVTDDLDPGERSAMALAEMLHADLLLIDEARLRVTGTLGVLRAWAELGLVDVPELVLRLRLQATSFYVDEALLQTVFEPWM
jgi:predicted nucleic acid-binding protein